MTSDDLLSAVLALVTLSVCFGLMEIWHRRQMRRMDRRYRKRVYVEVAQWEADMELKRKAIEADIQMIFEEQGGQGE